MRGPAQLYHTLLCQNVATVLPLSRRGNQPPPALKIKSLLPLHYIAALRTALLCYTAASLHCCSTLCIAVLYCRYYTVPYTRLVCCAILPLLCSTSPNSSVHNLAILPLLASALRCSSIHCILDITATTCLCHTLLIYSVHPRRGATASPLPYATIRPVLCIALLPIQFITLQTLLYSA